MAAYFSKSERCKDIPSSRKSGCAPSHNTIFLPVSNALIVVVGADYVADSGVDADGDNLFVLGQLLDLIFKDKHFLMI